MFWFPKRPRTRKVQKPQRRFEVQELEPRLPPGLTWYVGNPTEVDGILINDNTIFHLPDGYPAIVVVAGRDIWLSAYGRCVDSDTWVDDANQMIGTVEDEVSVTWTVGGVTKDGCRNVLITLGSAGVPGAFDINMVADDDPTIPQGDTGNRDDLAREFTTWAAAIWVDISLKMQGPMDDDDSLDFPDEAAPLDRELGGTELHGGDLGMYVKVELTGTIAPRIPDGYGIFLWRQKVDNRDCFRAVDGSVGGIGHFVDADDESPEPESRTEYTRNSKVFMIDKPGADSEPPVGVQLQPNELWVSYRNFTTWVEYNGVRASNDFHWHTSVGMRSDGEVWQPSWMSPAVQDDPNQTNPGPVGNPTSPFTHDFPVNCSNQVWW